MLLRISAFALQSISPLYVATARYNCYFLAFFCYNYEGKSTFIDCVENLIFQLHSSFLLSQDVRSNERAAYHHILPQINTTHTEKRGEIRKWKDGRVFVLGWADFVERARLQKMIDACAKLCCMEANQ
jgi:hypothetical protein